MAMHTYPCTTIYPNGVTRACSRLEAASQWWAGLALAPWLTIACSCGSTYHWLTIACSCGSTYQIASHRAHPKQLGNGGCGQALICGVKLLVVGKVMGLASRVSTGEGGGGAYPIRIFSGQPQDQPT